MNETKFDGVAESHRPKSPFHPLDSSLHDFANTQFGSLEDLRTLTPTAEGLSAIMVACSEFGFMPDQNSIFMTGQLYVVQNFGNVVLPISGTGSQIEVTQLLQTKGLRDVIVCGHLNCRATDCFLSMKQARQRFEDGDALRQVIGTRYENLDASAKRNVAAQENVLLQIENIVASLRDSNLAVRLYAWMTNGLTNRIFQFDPIKGQFAT